MRKYNESLLHSASDLNAFLGCAHAAALNLQKLREPDSLPSKAEDDESLQLIQDAGHSHEAAYLQRLKDEGQDVAEIPTEGSIEARAAATVEAMRQGREIIYQGTFFGPPWHGFADFLRRVSTPSALGEWSYEPIDTKLARTPDPKHVLQLGVYADLIAEVQDLAPHEMHLVLGNGKEETFRRVEFQHTLAAAKERYLGFIEDGAEASAGEPCKACTFCGWRTFCADTWEANDHLSLVAGIARSQINKLRSAGIATVVGLADALPGTRIPKMAPDTFERLRSQAVLQVARRSGEAAVELLPLEAGRGFHRLPAPNEADLFFDLEGDPLYPDGLEYLWGIHYRENGETRFRAEWAHDHDAERAAFERVVDFLTAHARENPRAHIYHYAAYEVTALRRLSTKYASREDEVDALLRGEKFVDLFAVVRQALRTSEPSLSLKALEVFFAAKREEAVTKADQSIVHYHRWRETGEQTLLDGIFDYNKVDCENTEGLRDWLVRLKPSHVEWRASAPIEAQPEPDERDEELDALREAVRTGATRLSQSGGELFSHPHRLPPARGQARMVGHVRSA